MTIRVILAGELPRRPDILISSLRIINFENPNVKRSLGGRFAESLTADEAGIILSHSGCPRMIRCMERTFALDFRGLIGTAGIKRKP